MSMRIAISGGALLAALGVGLGAFAAHGLEARLENWGYSDTIAQRIEWFETGVRYHMLHSVAIVLAGILGLYSSASRSLTLAVFALILGIVLFSGSLYVMTIAPAEWRRLGAVVPLGGMSYILGWIALAIGAWRSGSPTLPK